MSGHEYSVIVLATAALGPWVWKPVIVKFGSCAEEVIYIPYVSVWNAIFWRFRIHFMVHRVCLQSHAVHCQDTINLPGIYNVYFTLRVRRFTHGGRI